LRTRFRVDATAVNRKFCKVHSTGEYNLQATVLNIHFFIIAGVKIGGTVAIAIKKNSIDKGFALRANAYNTDTILEGQINTNNAF